MDHIRDAVATYCARIQSYGPDAALGALLGLEAVVSLQRMPGVPDWRDQVCPQLFHELRQTLPRRRG